MSLAESAFPGVLEPRRVNPSLPVDHKRLRALASKTGRSIEGYLVASYSESTIRPYVRPLSVYRNWCSDHDCPPFPADYAQLVRFFADATRTHQGPHLLTMVSAIQYLHTINGYSLDVGCIRNLMRSFVNTHSPPFRRAPALDREKLSLVLDKIPQTLIGLRDRALLLVGFAAALRPCELVGLDIGHATPGSYGIVIPEAFGLRIRLDRSKSDYMRLGLEKILLHGCQPCPLHALQQWLDAAAITSGPAFRRLLSGDHVSRHRLDVRSVSRIVKLRTRQVSDVLNADRDGACQYSGYSLRSGFVTSAVLQNVDAGSIARHVGWAQSGLIVRYTRIPQGCDRQFTRDLFEGR